MLNNKQDVTAATFQRVQQVIDELGTACAAIPPVDNPTGTTCLFRICDDGGKKDQPCSRAGLFLVW
ncbi:MAG: hypothetical protein L6Q98_12800 [Anaerolineae bacterium]|nr:hypothetical protein [Anaerolineae bacterium]